MYTKHLNLLAERPRVVKDARQPLWSATETSRHPNKAEVWRVQTKLEP